MERFNVEPNCQPQFVPIRDNYCWSSYSSTAQHKPEHQPTGTVESRATTDRYLAELVVVLARQLV